jgi:hypothetical protein
MGQSGVGQRARNTFSRRRAAGALAVSLALGITAASLGAMNDVASAATDATGALQRFFPGHHASMAQKGQLVETGYLWQSGFSITAAPAQRHVKSGHNVFFRVKANVGRNFTRDITLSAGPKNPDTSYSFVPKQITARGTAHLVISTVGAAPGTYPITIFGLSGTLTRLVTVTLVVS